MHLLIALSPLDLSTESIVEYIFIPLHFSPHPKTGQFSSAPGIFLSFFPWLWLWLEEQCQPLFDTLFAAKYIVCLVEEECCRRDIELVTYFGGGQDQVPHSLATCMETCTAEQLHRTAPIQTSSGEVTKQDSADLRFLSQNSHCPPPLPLLKLLLYHDIYHRVLCVLMTFLPPMQKFSFPSWCTEVTSIS